MELGVVRVSWLPCVGQKTRRNRFSSTLWVSGIKLRSWDLTASTSYLWGHLASPPLFCFALFLQWQDSHGFKDLWTLQARRLLHKRQSFSKKCVKAIKSPKLQSNTIKVIYLFICLYSLGQDISCSTPHLYRISQSSIAEYEMSDIPVTTSYLTDGLLGGKKWPCIRPRRVSFHEKYKIQNKTTTAKKQKQKQNNI